MNRHRLRNRIGCPNCKRLFDNNQAKRVAIEGCGHVCCQRCLDKLYMNEGKQCIYDQCDGKPSRNSSIDPQFQNQSNISAFQASLFCSSHPDEMSSLYCFECDQNMCFKCSQQQIHQQHQLMSEQNIEQKGKEVFNELENARNKTRYEYQDFYQDYVELMVKPKINSFKFQLSKNLEKKKKQIFEIFEQNRKSIVKQFDIMQQQFLQQLQKEVDQEKLIDNYERQMEIFEKLNSEQQNIQFYKKLLKNNMAINMCEQLEKLVYKFKDSENLYDQQAQVFVENLKLKFNFRKNEPLLILQNKNSTKPLQNSNEKIINLMDTNELKNFDISKLQDKSEIENSPDKIRRSRNRLQSDSEDYLAQIRMNKSQLERSRHKNFDIPKIESLKDVRKLTQNQSMKNLNQFSLNPSSNNLQALNNSSYFPLYKSQNLTQQPMIKLNNRLFLDKRQKEEPIKFQRRKFDLKPQSSQTRELKRNHHSLPNLLDRQNKLQKRAPKKRSFEIMNFQEALNAIEQGNQVINLKGNLKENQLLKFSEALKNLREVEYLNISSNGIEDRYFQLFCKKLPKIKIKHLDISRNQIFFDGLLKLCQFCQMQLRVYRITAKGLKLSELQQKKIVKEFQRIKTLICFD